MRLALLVVLFLAVGMRVARANPVPPPAESPETAENAKIYKYKTGKPRPPADAKRDQKPEKPANAEGKPDKQ